MKKLLTKDKILRKKLKTVNKKTFLFKLIIKNSNFFKLIRWNAFSKLKQLNVSNVSMVNRCILTINKKRLNNLTNFSRHIFLKLIRSGQINGMKKSSW